MAISLSRSKRRLAAVWYSGSGLLFFILLLQTVLGKFGSRVGDAWAWLLPTLLPTLSLITGVLVMETLTKSGRRQSADSFIFKVAFWLSIFYLATVGFTIFVSPLSEAQASITALELMKMSQLWLGPFQGLVTAALGAFFVKESPA